MIRQAVIPVAGKGTRFLPATKDIPKEMIPILKKPMIHYVVEEAVASGIEEIIFVTATNKSAIENYFQPNLELECFLKENKKSGLLDDINKLNKAVRIKTVLQDQQLGLGHAVLCAKKYINDSHFAVLLADDIIMSSVPVIRQLAEKSQQEEASVIGVMEVLREQTQKYGIIDGEKISKNTVLMKRMVEKPRPEDAPTLLATPGRYILSKKIFNMLETIPKGAGGEYQLTDAINELCRIEKVLAYQFEGERYDTGTIEGYFQATVDFALRDPEFKDFAKKVLEKSLKGIKNV